ncbi:hypothetical protein ACRAWF_22550 [Streptomyces sp. L7]
MRARPLGRTSVRSTRWDSVPPLSAICTVRSTTIRRGSPRCRLGQAGCATTTPPRTTASGLSERRLGDALAHRPRAEFTVSTKVGRLLEPHPAPTGSDPKAGGFAVPDTLIRRPDYSWDGVLRSPGSQPGPPATRPCRHRLRP